MPTELETNRPRKLVVGIDFSEMSEQALDVALETALTGRATEVHGLVVRQGMMDALGSIALPPPPAGDELRELHAMMDRRVKVAVARHGTSKLVSVVAHVGVGSPANEIARLAAELGADLVLVGTHGRKGVGRFLLGSVAEKTVRLCGCAVYVVRAKDHTAGETDPQVEPVCPDCVTQRAQTKGAEMWCARHSEHHPRAHVYSYDGPSTDAARPWGFDAQ